VEPSGYFGITLADGTKKIPYGTIDQTWEDRLKLLF
jgi:hypothetical protein